MENWLLAVGFDPNNAEPPVFVFVLVFDDPNNPPPVEENSPKVVIVDVGGVGGGWKISSRVQLTDSSKLGGNHNR